MTANLAPFPQGIELPFSFYRPLTYAHLPGAKSGYPGYLSVISDCNTATPGATAAGGGSNLVLVWWDGTAWIVVGGAAGEPPAYTSIQLTALTYSTLPATPSAGAIAAISDANTQVIGAVVSSGGGSDYVIVQYNGTNWLVFSATTAALFATLTGTTINAGASGTAGTIAVFPATASKGSTTLTATANSGNTVTSIVTAAQAGARTYTVPDAGANADFLLTGGTVSATTGLTPTPLPVTQFLTAAGIGMAATPSSTAFGQTVTLGTSSYLTGTATGSGSQANTAIIDVVLPAWYKAGTNITLTVTGYYTNSSSTASVHTCTAAAYLNAAAGTQGATIIATSAQTLTITTPTAMTFTITGTTLSPGSQITLSLTTNLTNGAGASTAFITGVSFT
jgi:hypothetical protein